MMDKLIGFFNVFDWMYGSGSPYVIESVFALMFSGFVLSTYIVMKIKKKRKAEEK